MALAWVQGRPGVASTIIGARRMDQLEQNLAALDLTLSADQIARLDKLSKPTLSFPKQFMNVASMFSHGGTTVNGEKGDAVADGAEDRRGAVLVVARPLAPCATNHTGLRPRRRASTASRRATTPISNADAGRR